MGVTPSPRSFLEAACLGSPRRHEARSGKRAPAPSHPSVRGRICLLNFVGATDGFISGRLPGCSGVVSFFTLKGWLRLFFVPRLPLPLALGRG